MNLEIRQPSGLPKPNKKENQRSAKVTEYISEKIKGSGNEIAFSEFMDYALYAEDIGYYDGDMEKFGEGGDFITAPEETDLIGKAIAKECYKASIELKNLSILEFGAGSGSMAVSVLKKLDQMKVKIKNYYIVDISKDLIKRQKEKILKELPRIYSRVSWITGIPKNFNGVIIANEVVDSMPFERFKKVDDKLFQVNVGTDEKNLVYKLKEADKELYNYIECIEKKIGNRLPSGYISEVSFKAKTWMKNIAENMNKGMLLIIDYGVSRNEYYSQIKNRGWLQCYFKHHMHDEPLIFPGIQDITTWVDFSLLAETALNNGMEVDAYLNQAQFILNNGIEEEFEDFENLNIKDQITLTKQVKLLTMPDKMGYTFKCLLLTKNFSSKHEIHHNGDRSYAL